MEKVKNIFKLFVCMLKIGLFTFGGGYAMVALLENEFVDKKKWITRDEFADMVAVAESTPGPLAINSATYIGYKTGGFLGALFSTLGVCIPSFVIIYVISLFFNAFLENKYVAYAFTGVRVCVAFLIAKAGVKMIMSLKKKAFDIIVVCCVVAAMLTLSLLSVNFSSIFYILIGGAAGVCIYTVRYIKGRREGKK